MQSVSTRRTFNEQSMHHQHSLQQFHQQSQENSSFELFNNRDDKFAKWSESETTLNAASQDCTDSAFGATSTASTMSISSAKFSSERSSSFSKISEDGDLPPALPVKQRTRSTRRERHISQYDNVESDHFPNPR